MPYPISPVRRISVGPWLAASLRAPRRKMPDRGVLTASGAFRAHPVGPPPFTTRYSAPLSADGYALVRPLRQIVGHRGCVIVQQVTRPLTVSLRGEPDMRGVNWLGIGLVTLGMFMSSQARGVDAPDPLEKSAATVNNAVTSASSQQVAAQIAKELNTT